MIMQVRGRGAGVLAALVLAAALCGCEQKVTEDAFNAIALGMTMGEVEAIMGGPGKDETAGGWSISGAGVISGSGSTRTRVYVWTEEERQIIVTFRDDVVADKYKAGF
jgi:hypothetical protein